MRAPINSVKHIVQTTLTNVSMGSVQGVTYARVVANGTLAQDIDEGTIIKAVYVEIWALANGQQPGTLTMCVMKLPLDTADPSFSDMQDLYTYANKKNIFHMTQGLYGDANSNPIPFYRGWVKIPKGKQRFGAGDKLKLIISNITDEVQVCGVGIYKAYT